MSVAVPIVVWDLTTTETPGMGSPVALFVTFPEISICADAWNPVKIKKAIKTINFLIDFNFKVNIRVTFNLLIYKKNKLIDSCGNNKY